MNERARNEGISDRDIYCQSVENHYKKICDEFALRIVRNAPQTRKSSKQTQEMNTAGAKEADNSALEQDSDTVLLCAPLEAVEPSIEAAELSPVLMSDLKRRGSD